LNILAESLLSAAKFQSVTRNQNKPNISPPVSSGSLITEINTTNISTDNCETFKPTGKSLIQEISSTISSSTPQTTKEVTNSSPPPADISAISGLDALLPTQALLSLATFVTCAVNTTAER
jgi:hypothetical protein